MGLSGLIEETCDQPTDRKCCPLSTSIGCWRSSTTPWKLVSYHGQLVELSKWCIVHQTIFCGNFPIFRSKIRTRMGERTKKKSIEIFFNLSFFLFLKLSSGFYQIGFNLGKKGQSKSFKWFNLTLSSTSSVKFMKGLGTLICLVFYQRYFYCLVHL